MDSPSRSSAPGARRTGRSRTSTPSSEVPFVEPRSATETRPSSETDTAQCSRETSGSSSGTSASAERPIGSARRAADGHRPRRGPRPHGAGPERRRPSPQSSPGTWSERTAPSTRGGSPSAMRWPSSRSRPAKSTTAPPPWELSGPTRRRPAASHGGQRRPGGCGHEHVAGARRGLAAARARGRSAGSASPSAVPSARGARQKRPVIPPPGTDTSSVQVVTDRGTPSPQISAGGILAPATDNTRRSPLNDLEWSAVWAQSACLRPNPAARRFARSYLPYAGRKAAPGHRTSDRPVISCPATFRRGLCVFPRNVSPRCPVRRHYSGRNIRAGRGTASHDQQGAHDDAAGRQQVPARGAARARRHGHQLSRAASETAGAEAARVAESARRDRGHQGPQGGAGQRRRRGDAVPAGALRPAALTHRTSCAPGTSSSRAISSLVMDLIDGPDLHRYLRENGPLTPVAAALLTAQIADALAASHADGVVHRDLKPRQRAPRRARRRHDPDAHRLRHRAPGRLPGLTRTHEFVGTPPTWRRSPPRKPPADLRRRRSTARASCCTSGSPAVAPFAGGTALEVLHRHLSESRRPPPSPDLCGRS